MSAQWRANEALNQTLRYLYSNQIFFRGEMILLATDFRQTLPVIPRSTAADGINACLKASILWRYVKNLINKQTNMQVALQNDISAEVFSKALLDIGNGRIPVDPSIGLILFPPNFCQFMSNEELILKVLPKIDANYKSHFSDEK